MSQHIHDGKPPVLVRVSGQSEEYNHYLCEIHQRRNPNIEEQRKLPMLAWIYEQQWQHFVAYCCKQVACSCGKREASSGRENTVPSVELRLQHVTLV